MINLDFNQLSYLAKNTKHNVEDIAALFNYNEPKMIITNKSRLEADIDCAIDSLKEMSELLSGGEN